MGGYISTWSETRVVTCVTGVSSVGRRHRQPLTSLTLWSMLPPPPVDTLQVVDIASLAAALTKLNVEIPIEDLIKVIQDEDEAKRVKVTAEATQRRAALSERKPAPAPCPLSDNEPGQCFQSLSNQPGQLPASNSPQSPSSSPSPPNPPMSIHWRRNVVVVSSNLPNSPFPTARFHIRSH